MTKQEILQKAIEKAVKNGYDPDRQIINILIEQELSAAFIFNHNFAKAFFGEQNMYVCECCPNRPCWEIALQEMVISEDPILYLEQYLK